MCFDVLDRPPNKYPKYDGDTKEHETIERHADRSVRVEQIVSQSDKQLIHDRLDCPPGSSSKFAMGAGGFWCELRAPEVLENVLIPC